MRRTRQVAVLLAGMVSFWAAACSGTAGKDPDETGTPQPPRQVGPHQDALQEPPVTVSGKELKALAAGNNQFAIELYKKLAEKDDGNIVVSPYSISSALAMTYAGARGETAEQMARTLHFALPPDQLHPAFS